MTDELNSKRLSDDELEAVSGGVTAPSVDPAALAAEMIQSQLNAALAVATGGAHPADTTAGTAPTAQNSTTISADAINAVFGTGASHSSASTSTGTSPSTGMPTSTSPTTVPDSVYYQHGIAPPVQTSTIVQNGVTLTSKASIYD